MARRSFGAIVVGAGAAGVGVAVALQHAGVSRLKVLDRHGVGATFDRWPREMRFITPSFPTNSVGMLDLNAVAIGTSPGFSLGCEHPTGPQYASYLRSVATHFELPIQAGVDVYWITHDGERFTLETSIGLLHAECVVWAAGEFQYPRLSPFPGAERCLHNSKVETWAKVAAREHVVIGGYESGLDAAVHLIDRGARVRVLERSSTIGSSTSDPSVALSPYTRERALRAQATGRLEIIDGAEIVQVEPGRIRWTLTDRKGNTFRTGRQPILATGFESSARLLHELFEWRDDGQPLLNEHDESTVTPGLYLCGPGVRHDQHVFCFIYKFRQRFAVVAKAIGERLGRDTSELEKYRAWGMFLDDLSCCGQECAC